MPNNDSHTHEHDDEAQLSRMLRQSAPPKSPAHLDESILAHAKQHLLRKNSGASTGFAWFSNSWIQAAAAFSVVGIAVSISLQPPSGELNLSSQSNKAAPATIPNADQRETSTLNEPREELDLASGVANLSVASAPQVEQLNTQPSARTAIQQAPRSQTLASADTARRQASNLADDSVGQTQTTNPDSVLEEVVVTGSFIRSASQSAAISTVAPSLKTPITIQNDESITALLEALESVVIDPNLNQNSSGVPLNEMPISSRKARLLGLYSSAANTANWEAEFSELLQDSPVFDLPSTLSESITLLNSLDIE